MKQFMKSIIKDLVKKTIKSYRKEYGGPFGACILDKDNNVVAKACNEVLKRKDPTCHAEVNAIRKACKKLNTYDLTGYKILTTCYPCPMCMSAIIWANIKEVYYCCNQEDADKIGFRDDFIYKAIRENNYKMLSLNELEKDDCLKMFEDYKNLQKVIY